MDSETQIIYSNILSIAEKIDKDLIKKGNSHESVKELLRMDLRDFLIFLTVADHVVAKDEIRYINKSLGYDFDNETMKRYAIDSPIMHEDFLNNPPASMKYFLDYRNNDEIVQESKYYDIKKLYIMTFQAIGEDFLATCRHIDSNEVNQLTRYRFMLESKINAYTKSGGVAPHRPDSIPFKLKERTTFEGASTESDIPFMGSISGGDKTSADLDSLLEELDNLIGLDSVKSEVKNLINLLKIIEIRKKQFKGAFRHQTFCIHRKSGNR